MPRNQIGWALAFVLVGLLAAIPGSAAASTASFRALPGIASTYTSVSERFIVYGRPEVSRRRITVVDTKRLTTRNLELPADCRLFSHTPGFGPRVAGSRALFSCTTRDVLLDLRTDAFTTVPKPAGGDDWFDLGTRWLEASAPCESTGSGSPSCRTFANLATGEVRTVETNHVEYDLDSNNLDPVVVCSPFDRQANLTVDRWQRWGDYLILDKEPMEIGRCGHKAIRIGGRDPTTSRASLVGGWASYLAYGGCPRLAYAYRVDSKRTYQWKTPVVKRAKCIGDVIHTKYAIVVPLIAKITREDSEEEFAYRLVIRRLPD